MIPTYNCADLLKKAIESVSNQTFLDYEILIIDNYSTDHTNDVLNSFKNLGLRLFKVNNNGIIAISRNVGIKNARGEWIAFLDSDDVWYPEKLEFIKREIEKEIKAILICHNEWCVVNGKKEKILKHGPSSDNMYENLIFYGNCISTSATCLEAKVAVSSGGFSEEKKYITVEDYEYWVRLSKLGRFHFIEYILGDWNIHKNNYSNSIQIHSEAFISLKEYLFDLWLIKKPKDTFKVRFGLGRAYYATARNFQKFKIYSKAKKHLKLSLSFNPFQIKSLLLFIIIFLRIDKK